jgi:hypothetical protein
VSRSMPIVFGELGRFRNLPGLIFEWFSVVDIQGDDIDVFNGSNTAFGPAFEALWKSQSITCKSSGAIVSGLPRPIATIIDVSTTQEHHDEHI